MSGGLIVRSEQAEPATPAGLSMGRDGRLRDAKGRLLSRQKLDALAAAGVALPVAPPPKKERDRDPSRVRFDCPRHAFLKLRCPEAAGGYLRFSYGRCVTSKDAELAVLRNRRYANRYGIFEESGEDDDDGNPFLYQSADGTFWYSDEARLAHDRLDARLLPRVGYLPE
jgi:hypothetical protein